MAAEKTKPTGKKKNSGGAPPAYDDDQLLAIAAELLAWPEQTGITSQTAALDKALTLIPASGGWTPSRFRSEAERLRKKFRAGRPELIAAVRSRKPLVMHEGRAFDYRGPALPQLLETPRAPDLAAVRSRAERLTDTLRGFAAQAADLASAIERRLALNEDPALTLLPTDDRTLADMKKMLDRLSKGVGKNSDSISH